MNRIFWLASYPKSGNTWFRVFLCNLLADMGDPVSINGLHNAIPIASHRVMLDENMGVEASDLRMDEIDRLRPRLYCQLAENAEEPIFMKIHDAYTYVADNMPLIPDEATAGVIYIIRNPLDVAVSFAHHSGWDYDTSITRMSDATFALHNKRDGILNQFRQKLLTWSGHVKSWLDIPSFPVCVLRYEDMKNMPLETFSKAVSFTGLSRSIEQIRKAMDFSSFDIVQKQEKEEGFREKAPVSTLFFRKGKVGSWREELNPEQIRRIVRDHREVMQRFGYLDERENIVY